MFTESIIFAGLASLAAAAPASTYVITQNITTAPPAANCPVPRGGLLADTVQNFLQDPILCGASAIAGAYPPQGYSTLFAGAKGSNQALYGYMGYEQMLTYNPSYCAAQCNAKAGCASFNIYFERDPSVDPTDDCQNPASNWNFFGLNNTRCAYYSSILDVSTATNTGQYREQFQVAITGSNAYVKNSIFTATGYTPMTGATANGHLPTDKALNAPLACNGAVDTYAGVEWWNDGLFSVQRCADSCSRHTAWTNAQGGKPCESFNTYLQRDSTSGLVQQMCAFYTQETNTKYAVNGGNGEGNLKVFNSYAFTVAGYSAPVCPNTVQAG